MRSPPPSAWDGAEGSSPGSTEPDPEPPEAVAWGESVGRDSPRATAPRLGRVHRGPKAKGEILTALQEELERDFTRLGKVIAFGLPLTGLVVVNRATRAAQALTALAAQNAQILKLLQATAGITIYADLAFIAADIGAAVAVERQLMPMEHPLAASIQPEIQIMLKLQRQAETAQAVQGNSAPAA